MIDGKGTEGEEGCFGDIFETLLPSCDDGECMYYYPNLESESRIYILM